ncbi:unnamed protein product [Rhodiola kirilowii]
MGSRFPSHQLSNGLYVSGRPEQPKERAPTTSVSAMPYTGGDIKKSGELGKMIELHAEASRSRKSGPVNNASSRTGSLSGAAAHSGPLITGGSGRPGSHSSGIPGSVSMKNTSSGPLNKHGEPLKKSSGPQSGVSRHNSGQQAPVLPATGLITSGPISSGPLNASGAPRKISGQLDSTGSVKIHNASIVNNQAVTNLSQMEYTFQKNFPKLVLWSVILLFLMGFIAGGFILGAVHNPILLIVVVILFCVVITLFMWNNYWGRRAIIGFIAQYPDTELRTARNGQFVKISGVVTCGNVPLESSYGKVQRCVYTSTSLYEYRGWNSKAANGTRRLTWGLRSCERYVVDFYISDFHTGLRALVKTGYGARVTPYVDESVVVDIDETNKDMSPQFVRWLSERNLSSDDQMMRLKEGYIKEGSTVSVMGVVHRNENVLMIVPPTEPFNKGCQWTKGIIPANLDGIVVRCENSSKTDNVIPV